MLSHWFLRDGISQILAPDANAPKPPDEAQSEVLQFLAPDPKFAPPKAPPPTAFSDGSAIPDNVLCQNCHQWTPITFETPSSLKTPTLLRPPTTPANGSSATRSMSAPFMTPSPSYKPSEYGTAIGQAEHVESLVMSGVKETVFFKFSPKPKLQKADRLFRFCSGGNRLDEKTINRFKTLIEKNPWLLHARAKDLGQTAPDGFTPLMAAAYYGKVEPLKVLIEFAMANDVDAKTSIFDERDTEGRTALHLASEYGHDKAVEILLPHYQMGGDKDLLKSPMPLNLTGRTPFGSAITSPHAKKKQKELSAQLFSPRDLSIIGVPRPEYERTSHDEDLKLSYGIADMPGLRVNMEDAICTYRFNLKGKPYGLFGVCDGHGDQGLCSEFVAKTIPEVLQAYMKDAEEEYDWDAIWKATCLEVDQRLQKEDNAGGSTAIFALVGPDSIVVANVGDSRAILVHNARATSTGLEESMEKITVAESAEGYPSAIDADKPQKVIPDDVGEPIKASSGPVVKALSDDHKPDLPDEQARIEKAGMSVKAITFMEEGEEMTIHKVAKSDSDMLAVSRSFGDFDYKANTTLSPEEQAVAVLPDVRVHTRNPESDLYLVLACDGIWDVCDNGFVKDFVLKQVEARRDDTETVLPQVADALLLESLGRGSKDNMSTILVALDSQRLALQVTGKALDFTSL